ncbi:MAG: ankyrin repeat domain-containing protein [Burkholderiaceae bacterium]
MKLFIRIIGLAFVLSTSLACGAATIDDLFGAAAIDNLRDVRRLIQDRVIDPKVLDPRGDTLLIAAIRNDASRVTDFLIADRTTDVDATNVSGETAMMIAAYRNKKDIVEKLIARDAEVNRTGWTALHYAASVDARDIVALLLEHAAYIDAESPNRTTPLMMAARGGFEPLCHQLIDAGADPTPVNERSLSAADFARRGNSVELGKYLDAQVVAWRAKYGTLPPKRQ